MPTTRQGAAICGGLAVFTLGVAATSIDRIPLLAALLFTLAALLLWQADQ
jgi:hypothetical protein